MCCTRSHVSGSSSMYSSSTPSVYWSPFPKRCSSTPAPLPPRPIEPLPVITAGRFARSRPEYHRFGLDFHQPTWIEELRDDPGRRRACRAERLAVRPPDVVDQARVGDVDARAHDVLERRACLRERPLDDPEAHLGLLVGAAGRRRVSRHDRRGTGDPDLAPDADGAGVADALLERGAGRDELPFHLASLAVRERPAP